MAYTMTDKQFSSGNFYEVLGVDPNASQNEIKRMYQVLVLKVGYFMTFVDFSWTFAIFFAYFISLLNFPRPPPIKKILEESLKC